ncbi:putative Bracovirus protein MdBV-24 [Microplitis demolitor]
MNSDRPSKRNSLEKYRLIANYNNIQVLTINVSAKYYTRICPDLCCWRFNNYLRVQRNYSTLNLLFDFNTIYNASIPPVMHSNIQFTKKFRKMSSVG